MVAVAVALVAVAVVVAGSFSACKLEAEASGGNGAQCTGIIGGVMAEWSVCQSAQRAGVNRAALRPCAGRIKKALQTLKSMQGALRV